MAEVGVIASALQIADIGVRLSLRLYTFGETVASADKSIIAISEHVSLTSTVLKELGQTLDKDQISRICSSNAVQTADSIVKQCQKIFQEMDHVLVKKFANTKSTEKDRRIKAAQTLERLKWPFVKGKIDLLMSNLEKQKSTLVLMVNVIALAKQEHERTEPYTIIAEQRSLIEDLAKSNEEYIRKFDRLKLSCEEAPIDQESVPADWSSSMPTPKTPTAHEHASTLAVDAPSQRASSADAKRLDLEPYKGSDIPSSSSSDRLGWLLQQYSNLMRSLLREVSAPNYEIAEESRSRINADIVTTHQREMTILKSVQGQSKPSRRHGVVRKRLEATVPPIMAKPGAIKGKRLKLENGNPCSSSSADESDIDNVGPSEHPPIPRRVEDTVQSCATVQRCATVQSRAVAQDAPSDDIIPYRPSLLQQASFGSVYTHANTEDSAGNVVDKLLATWTRPPIHASQPKRILIG